MSLTDLPNLEESALMGLILTAGGQQIVEPIDEALSRKLNALWNELGIREIE